MSGPVAAPGYWTLVWRQLKKNAQGMVGLVMAASIVVTAAFAPLIANDRPIVATHEGSVVFPAATTYVDTWVPWRSLQFGLKSLKIGGGYPFSDHYTSLKGRSWKEVDEAGELGMVIWPPIPWNPVQFSPGEVKLPPGGEHILGTDDLGRDVLARLVHGTVVAMLVGIIAMGIACSLGVSLGLTAGFFGGRVDALLSRITEIVICFPTFFLIIAIIAFVEPSIVNIMIVIGLVRWTGIFRLIRGEVIAARDLEYVTAAKALGLPTIRVMFRHVLPNVISPIFVAVAFGIASAVLTESSLSFLGFGDPNAPSWGEIVSQGRSYVNQGLWHLTVFPGIALFITLTAFNLFGQGLRDAMDPRLRQ